MPPLSKVRRLLALVAYYAIVQHLPARYGHIDGKVFGSLRNWVCRGFVAEAGDGISIGSHVHLGDGSGFRIGDRSGLGDGSQVHGGVTIGDDVMIGPEVVFLSDNHRSERIDVPIGEQGYTERAFPRIEDQAWIGARVIILAGRVIGHGAVVGAGAVVTHDVAPYDIVGGNPARVIRSRLDTASASSSAPAATPPG
jgi:maltose O-acetyltransferase